MNILGLCGSLRPGSSNERLIRAAFAMAPGATTAMVPDPGSLPHFNPALDGDALPPAVAAFRRAIADADGLVVSSPEYAHGIPGTLKNALDWLVSTTVLLDMPLLLISASPSGGEYVHAQLTEVLSTMSAPPLSASFQARGRQAFGDDGAVVDERVHHQLTAGMAALVTAVEARSRG